MTTPTDSPPLSLRPPPRTKPTAGGKSTGGRAGGAELQALPQRLTAQQKVEAVGVRQARIDRGQSGPKDQVLLSSEGLAWAGCRLLSRSPIVHFDGPVSVQGAFQLSEVRALAAQAGLEGAELRRSWPERYLLRWRRPSHSPQAGGANPSGM